MKATATVDPEPLAEHVPVSGSFTAPEREGYDEPEEQDIAFPEPDFAPDAVETDWHGMAQYGVPNNTPYTFTSHDGW